MIDSEKKTILCGREVGYILKISRRARKIRLAIYGDGRFVVTAPYLVDERVVNRFIGQKSSWIVEKLDYFQKYPSLLSTKGNSKEFLIHKSAALEMVKRRLAYFNDFYQFSFRNISIRNQKTRWGSCSRQGNLSFNYKIVLMPENISDYIIVHELCHLKEFNHSKKFWQLVEKMIPDYLSIRKKIKKNDVF